MDYEKLSHVCIWHVSSLFCRYRCCIEMAERIGSSRFLAWRLPSSYSTVRACVFKEVRVARERTHPS